jgi:hypothetical protein
MGGVDGDKIAYPATDRATVVSVRDAPVPGAVKSRRTARGPGSPAAPTPPRDQPSSTLRAFARFPNAQDEPMDVFPSGHNRGRFIIAVTRALALFA